MHTSNADLMTLVKLTGKYGGFSSACLGGNRILKYLILATITLTCTFVYFIYDTHTSAERVDKIHAFDASPSVS